MTSLLAALLLALAVTGHGRPALATGITEQNANLLWSAAARPHEPAGFGPWRDRLAALRPDYYRLMVDWAQVQPRPGTPPDWDETDPGCMRRAGPCAPYGGMRARLDAIRSQQRAQGGFQVVVMIYDVPAWAAAPAGGCERPGTPPADRGPSAAAIPAYRALIRSLLALGRQEGVALPYWSAWNEPNHPAFMSPQRARCDASSPPLTPARYAQLVRALEAELRAAPGGQQAILGETAGFARPTAYDTDPVEFEQALPRPVVCSSDIWAQHVYVQGPARSESRSGAPQALVARLLAALDARGCARPYHLWITETGVADDAAVAGCDALAAALAGFAANPRVDAAFQYSFRSDPAYPVGLVDPGLTHADPAYALWRAWANGPEPGNRGLCPATAAP